MTVSLMDQFPEGVDWYSEEGARGVDCRTRLGSAGMGGRLAGEGEALALPTPLEVFARAEDAWGIEEGIWTLADWDERAPEGED